MRRLKLARKGSVITAAILLGPSAWANYCIQISSAPLSEKEMLVQQVKQGQFQGLPSLRVERRGSLAVVRAGDFPTYTDAKRYLSNARAVRSDAFIRMCEIDPQKIIYQSAQAALPASTAVRHTPRQPVPTPSEIENYTEEEAYMRNYRTTPQPRLRQNPPPVQYEAPYPRYRNDAYAQRPYDDLPPPYPETAGRPVPSQNLREIEEMPSRRPEPDYEVSPLNALSYSNDARLWEECKKCFAYRERNSQAAPTGTPPATRQPMPRYAPQPQPETRQPPRPYTPRYTTHPQARQPLPQNRVERYPVVENRGYAGQADYSRYPSRSVPQYDGEYGYTPKKRKNPPAETDRQPVDTKDFWLREMSRELDSKTVK
ncbi:MAG: hypothetical protein GXO33_02540 [Epsilonproteobacteria bacterium]|nr:hypothetical protein [Campylobacterota bacterium]